MGAAQECDGDFLLARFGREADVLQPRVDRRHRRILILIDGFLIRVAADDGLKYLHAVDRDDQRVLELEVVDPQRADQVGDRDLVLAVGREEVIHHESVARAER